MRSVCSKPHQLPVASRCRAATVVRAQNERQVQESLTGEWSASWSLASYEDVGDYFNDQLFKDEAAPSSLLSDIMSTDMTVAFPDTTVEELTKMFTTITGLPVVESASNRKLIGVVSKKDLNKSGSVVREIMSSPPVASRPDSKVADAACLMLKHKVHRIPIVNENAEVVGIVTRTDIFTALALDAGSSDVLQQ